MLYINEGLKNTACSCLGPTATRACALAGPGDDRRLIQITAPVQQGNSGVPEWRRRILALTGNPLSYEDRTITQTTGDPESSDVGAPTATTLAANVARN